MPKEVFGLDFSDVKPRGMGKVYDIVYIKCKWPNFDKPTWLFSEDSGRIQVQGPPTARNILFPDDTVFLGVLVDDSPVDIQKSAKGEMFVANERKYRCSESITANPLYIRTKGIKQVMQEVEVTKELEVSLGVFKLATFKQNNLVPMECDIVEELTREQAKAIAE